MGVKHLNKQQNKGDDEYYTRYESVKYICEKSFGPFLKDKIIYCPCDSERSNIVKYLQDTKEQWMYKDLIYTSNNMFVNQELFKKCDIIFTNPPFKHFPQTLRFMNAFHKKFILWISNTGALVDPTFTIYKPVFINCPILCEYDRPDGSTAGVNTVIISNIFQAPEYGFKELTFKHTLQEGLQTGNVKEIQEFIIREAPTYFYKNVEYCKYDVKNQDYIPNDYKGQFTISTDTYMRYYKYFDLVYDKHIRCIIDGKCTFTRAVVKLKDK